MYLCQLDVEHNLYKRRLTADGQEIDEEKHHELGGTATNASELAPEVMWVIDHAMGHCYNENRQRDFPYRSAESL